MSKREERRARLLAACQYSSDEVNREEHVERILDVLDGPPFGAHAGYWREHKHPLDRAAEVEEAWRFPYAVRPRA